MLPERLSEGSRTLVTRLGRASRGDSFPSRNCRRGGPVQGGTSPEGVLPLQQRLAVVHQSTVGPGSVTAVLAQV